MHSSWTSSKADGNVGFLSEKQIQWDHVTVIRMKLQNIDF